MDRVLPKRLRRNGCIGIVSTSRYMNEKRKEGLENFKEHVTSLGFRVKYGRHLFSIDKWGAMGGSVSERAQDLHNMFLDEDVDLIWPATAGFGAIQLIEHLDYDLIKKNPKLVLGMSDVDNLLLAITAKTKIPTINSCNPKRGLERKEFDFAYTEKWFFERLVQGSKEFEQIGKWECLREGKAQGRIVGCNLTVLCDLAGTEYLPDLQGNILFLEIYKRDIETTIDSIMALKLKGVFDQISGLVIGNNPHFGSDKFTCKEIVLDLLKEYTFPILKMHEFGHFQEHAFIPIGSLVSLDATSKRLEIIEDFVQ